MSATQKKTRPVGVWSGSAEPHGSTEQARAPTDLILYVAPPQLFPMSVPSVPSYFHGLKLHFQDYNYEMGSF